MKFNLLILISIITNSVMRFNTYLISLILVNSFLTTLYFILRPETLLIFSYINEINNIQLFHKLNYTRYACIIKKKWN